MRPNAVRMRVNGLELSFSVCSVRPKGILDVKLFRSDKMGIIIWFRNGWISVRDMIIYSII